MKTKRSITILTGLAAFSLIAACTPETTPTTGRSDYATYCADCHGASGKGNGPAAASLSKAPSDLTTLALRNGGTFPSLAAMGKIHGGTMGRSESAMPEFGPILDGKTVLFDAGDGIETPTPWRLVALTKYLQSIQQK